MSASIYVTVREASQLLGISESKIMSLIDEKKLLSYRIADQYLRLKRTDVVSLRDSGAITAEMVRFPYTMQERFQDFLAYNDFYIVSAVVILVLLGIVFFWR